MPKPKHAFIIMPIGRPDLDVIYYEAIRPVLKSPEFGLDERRVDKHNEGGLLKNEILDLLEAADLVVADLTYARPNVYLEVGYALSHHRVQEGRGKCPRLILTVRADHIEGHPHYDPNGFKVHFDLAGYDIVPWEDAADLKKKLTDKVRQRLSAVRSLPQPQVEPFDKTWYDYQQSQALSGQGFRGMTVFEAALIPPIQPRVTAGALAQAGYAAYDKRVRGVCFSGRQNPDIMPKPVGDDTIRTRRAMQGTFEVWSARGDGAFHRVAAFDEDLHPKNNPGDLLWFDVQLWDYAAILHFIERFYTALEVRPGTDVYVRAVWAGLKGRRISAVDGDRAWTMCPEDFAAADALDYRKEFRFAHGSLDLKATVKNHLAGLFELFGFASFEDRVYDSVLNKIPLS